AFARAREARAARSGTEPSAPTAAGAARASSAGEAVKERWAPIAAFAVSATAFVVFLRKLAKS
ncbi:MAG: hypothetical protein HOQ07_02315, partial [Sinomonas sp.]|nr:hypothetical protein [Sinomonas sp.]